MADTGIHLPVSVFFWKRHRFVWQYPFRCICCAGKQTV